MLGIVLDAEGRGLPKGTPWVTLPICTSNSLCLQGGGEGGPCLSTCVVWVFACSGEGLRVSLVGGSVSLWGPFRSVSVASVCLGWVFIVSV